MSTETYEFPATPTQEALWFIHRMDPASSAYNIPLAFRVSGPLDETALEKAFTELVRRHEIFRTVFAERDGHLVQIVRPDFPPDWRSESLTVEGDLRSFSVESASKHAAEVFDLESGPLVRVRLERYSEKDALLVVVFHHIVIDHLSLGQCAGELSVLYRDLAEGSAISLSKPEFQFADYTVWLKEHSTDTELARKLPVWQRRLSGFSGVLDLPTDSPRPALQSNRGAEFRFSIDEGTASEAKRFARTEGVSLFVVTLGALEVLLHHYSRQRDLIIGVPFANRGDQEELERVVGCFINTLPIAIDVTRINTFRELLASVKETMLEAFEIQDVPFETIVDAVKPRRDPSHNPLFQVGFVMQAPPVQLQFEGLDLEDLQTHSGGAMYDLHFWLWERDSGIEGLVWYNTDLYSEETIRRMAGHYQNVLAQLLANPDSPVNALVVPTRTELDQFDRWNANERQWPETSSVVDLIRQQCRRTPDKIAVQGRSQTYTYAELDSRSDRLASYLRDHGVGTNALVAISIDRDADMLVGLLGILKAGAAYVPMDPDYPDKRLRHMLHEAEIKVLLTKEGLLSDLPDHPYEKILLDSDWVAIERASLIELPPLEPEMRMYVIYTSGSTGLPKGVQVSHRSVINLLRGMAERPDMSEQDRLLAVTTLSFDMAVVELYLPLTLGATIIIAPREVAADGNRLRAMVESEGVTFMQGTPSTWRLLLSAGWTEGKGFRCLCGGEVFPLDVARQLLAGGVDVWNGYGPTEATVYSTFFHVTKADSAIPIGTPIANTACYVLNAQGNRVPIGIPGELYLGGQSISQGYLKSSDLTAESFLVNPFETGLLYRTGDLARFRSDGAIDYLDRLDRQVKVRGFRIEPGEIEAVLARHASVAEVAVLAREYAAADKRLVAYVRFTRGQRATSSELRRYLRDYLPDYMIPQLVVELDVMPLTASGKIDRRALPDPLEGRQEEQPVFPPMNENEARLIEIFRRTLGTETVSTNNNFFDIGGHSLLAMQVIFHIEREFDVRLNPRDLILNTLEQLAARLPAREETTRPEPSARDKRGGLLERVKEKLGI